MTTWTTEDRKNASPPHIVDSGASYEPIPFVGYVDVEKENLRGEIQSLKEELARLNNELLKYKVMTSKTFIYDPEDDDSVWIIEKL